jgi:cryptochrome
MKDSVSGPLNDYSVPTLSSLGLPTPTTHIIGGETQALARLSSFLSQPLKVATFSKPLSAPTALEPSTTLFSPYLKFGCLSVRKVWWGVQEVCEEWEKRNGSKGMTKEPENFVGQVSACIFFWGGEGLIGRVLYMAANG